MRGKADIEAPYPGSCSSPSMVSTRKLRTREPRARLGASGLDWHTFTSAGAVSPAPVVPLAQQVGVLKRAQPPCKQILTRSRKLRKTPCPDQMAPLRKDGAATVSSHASEHPRSRARPRAMQQSSRSWASPRITCRRKTTRAGGHGILSLASVNRRSKFTCFGHAVCNHRI
ncbi:uncharacterized protein LOC125941808 [Dermacentor silvarum]|nr:uncharacterized protein LOC125941808 [Dermacentor silvarum]